MIRKLFSTTAAVFGVLFLVSNFAHADHHKKAVALEGVWNAVAESDNGEREFKVTVVKKGDSLTGSSVAVESGNERKIDRISIKKKTVTFEYDMERDGEKALIKVVAVEKKAGKLDGKWSVEGPDGAVLMSGPWRAEKEVKFSLIGEWAAIGTTDDGEEYPSKLIVMKKGQDLKGKFDSEEGELEVNTVKVDGKEVHLAFVMTLDGNDIPTTVEAEAVDNNSLKGKWIIKDASDEIAASGGWTAKRTMNPVFKLAGDWDVVAALPEDAEYTGTLSIKKEGDKFSGSSKGDDSEARELKTVSFDGKNLVFTVGIEMNGEAGIITVTAVKEGDNTLKGRWSLANSDGEEVATDSWQAARKEANK